MSCKLCLRLPPPPQVFPPRLPLRRSLHSSTAQWKRGTDDSVGITRRRSSRSAEEGAVEADRQAGTAQGGGSESKAVGSALERDETPYAGRPSPPHLTAKARRKASPLRSPNLPSRSRYDPSDTTSLHSPSTYHRLPPSDSLTPRRRPKRVLQSLVKFPRNELLQRYKLSHAELARIKAKGYLEAKAKVVRKGPSMIDVMEIGFLGTSAGSPSTQRNVSCTALRMDGDLWLFDCGEGSWRQMMQTTFKAQSIRKIFITHLHGDHVLGLAVMLLSIGTDAAEKNRETHGHPFVADTGVIDIYGPPGLRRFLRMTFELTHSRTMNRSYRVTELHGFPGRGRDPPMPYDAEEASRVQAGEEGGRDLWCDEEGRWRIIEGSENARGEGTLSVEAVIIDHTVDCVGYIIREPNRREKFDMDFYNPLLTQHADEIAAAGFKPARAIFSVLERTKAPVTLPSGAVIPPPPLSVPGRTIVILGDTHDASRVVRAFPPGTRGPDVLVHEATGTTLPVSTEVNVKSYPEARQSPLIEKLVASPPERSEDAAAAGSSPTAFLRDLYQLLPDVDLNPNGTEAAVREVMRSRGHSTTTLAGEVAGAIGARWLLMNHVSAKGATPWANVRPPFAAERAPDPQTGKPVARRSQHVHENHHRYPPHPSDILLESNLKDRHMMRLPQLAEMDKGSAEAWMCDVLWTRAAERQAERGSIEGAVRSGRAREGEAAPVKAVLTWDFLTIRIPLQPKESPTSSAAGASPEESKAATH